MNIGFYINWPLKIMRSIEHVCGEELYAESLCREFKQFPGVKSVQVYSDINPPTYTLDVMIHLNDSYPCSFARKHILYMQNFYNEGSDGILRKFQEREYDGYVFFSQKLLDLHVQNGYKGIFLPLAADTSIFYPRKPDPKYEFDVVYVGSDIKGENRTMHYIYPAIKYNFGLFGFWRATWHNHRYKRILSRISRGNITREDSAVLYSSSKIALNCTGQDSINWDAMNLRFFEVLACKGFLLSDRVPSAARLLKDCLVFTDGGKDLEDKIEYYLTRPKERKEIAENGYQYVKHNATVQAVAKRLFEYVQEVIS